MPNHRHGDTVIYTEYNETDNYVGLVRINSDGTNKTRLESHANIWDGGRHGKFVPESATGGGPVPELGFAAADPIITGTAVCLLAVVTFSGSRRKKIINE